MDLLVSYSWNHFYPTREEIMRILQSFGDPAAKVIWSSVMGIAIVHTSLDNREVIKQCHDLFKNESQPFQFAIKWAPVDYWCETSLAAIKEAIDLKIAPQIGEHETWGMKVKKRRWQQYHTSEIVEYLAADIKRKVNLDQPDKLVWVDVLSKRTALSLLKPGEIFSLRLPYP